MIRLINLSKTYYIDGVPNTIFEEANIDIPTGASVGLLGRNGSGKSSLLRMVAGIMRPTTGRVEVTGSMSWPVGFSGGFHGDLTGAQNARFVARIYGVETDGLVDFVAGFAELGEHLFQPVRTYSQGMRARLAFGVSMGIPFDTYLIDEVTAVGDASFKAKSQQMLRDRLARSGAVIVNHSMKMLKETCDVAILIEDGVLTYYDDILEAIEVHKANMKVD